ncbi:glycosyltransferase family 2 protein [Celerinatantimonas sp. YJH-8]|uniref:glycosyltransferase family 2 protein n=1 Tax=Celerinatantimonas sp. YJH-8 TaxID=3228714 RepID=UPI0038BE3081
MKLSVIVPAYNLEQYIGPCLESLLTQQCDFDFEVLVCNDASSDTTAAVLASLQQRWPQLQVITNPQNLGLVATMGRLLDAATGRYIAYLDGDDLALPGKLQAQVDYLETHPGCAIAYHEAEMFDSDSGQLLKLYSRDYYNARYIPLQAGMEHLIRYGTFLQASSIMFRRHVHLIRALEHGCAIICDYPWHIMNAGFIGGSIDRIDGIYGRYRVHGNSFGAQTSRDVRRRLQVTQELEQACRLGAQFGLSDEVIDAGIAHVRFSAALYFLRQGEDSLFSDMIQASANHDHFFDDRHRQALAWCHQPQQVRQMLGWLAS